MTHDSRSPWRAVSTWLTLASLFLASCARCSPDPTDSASVPSATDGSANTAERDARTSAPDATSDAAKTAATDAAPPYVPLADAAVALPHVVPSETGPMVWFPAGEMIQEGGGPRVWPAPVDPFEIDVREVTVATYSQCVTAGRCTPTPHREGCNQWSPDRKDHPINCLRADQADAFCAWAKKRLPTDPEWDRAAKFPDVRRYPWGDLDDFSYVDSSKQDSLCCFKSATCPVGAHPKTRTSAGVDDLFGNVREWTSTTYCEDAPALLRCVPGTRFIRGGDYLLTPKDLRQSVRVQAAEKDDHPENGVRCARSAK